MDPLISSSSVASLDAQRRRKRRRNTDRLLGWALLGFLAGAALVFAAFNRDEVLQVASTWLDTVQDWQVPADAAHFDGWIGVCRDRDTPTCVIDGDTIRLHNERIRLVGIDAPELFDSGCEAERALALRARDRLSELLSSEPWRVVPDGTDRFGRTLANVRLERDWAGSVLVREGLAQWYENDWDWC
ncbi:thermonuclease family protein [Ahrensia marina]|uniref:thermonuclease family protein n=1 Tax=Ahrensia marina TaxID=1514904 RepID=UPI0035CF6049